MLKAIIPKEIKYDSIYLISKKIPTEKAHVVRDVQCEVKFELILG